MELKIVNIFDRKRNKFSILTFTDFLSTIEADLEDQVDYSTDLIYEEEEPAEALYVRSRKGTAVLQYKGHRYRRAYRTKNGTRWNCSLNKNCGAFIYLNDHDEILMSYEDHDHPKRTENHTAVDQNGNRCFISNCFEPEHYTYIT